MTARDARDDLLTLEELAYLADRGDQIPIAAARRVPDLVRSDPRFAEQVAELEALAREAGMEALLRLNRETLARIDRDKGRPDADRRMSFGVYFFDAVGADPSDPSDGEEG